MRDFKEVMKFLYVLLALLIVVSVFGIVNTLVLTVYERTREIGMLRAIGLTRRQTRRMIRNESVITALIGAALGIVLGLVLGGLMAARVEGDRVRRSRRPSWSSSRSRRSSSASSPRSSQPAARPGSIRSKRSSTSRDTGCSPRRGASEDVASLTAGAPGDAVSLGRLGDRRRDGRRDVAVEHARDHVLGAELVGGDHRRDRVAGGELHLLGDRAGADVERAAEEPGKASTLLIWFG